MRDAPPHMTWSPTPAERDELRREAEEPLRFLGGEQEGDGRASPWVGPLGGVTYILVPPVGDERPWRDPMMRIGRCSFHKDRSRHEPLSEDPCVFRVNSYFAGPVPEHLYIALLLDMLAARPEMSRRLAWRSVRKWRIVRLRLNGVRVADLTGRAAEDFLPGGEPMLRHSEASWGYLRWAHTRQCAALAIVESDPAGSRVASRLLFFCHAADALCEIGALEVAEIRVAPRRWPAFGARGGDGRRLLPRLILPTPGRRPRIVRGYDSLTRTWAAHRRRLSRKRERRRARWSAMREIVVRELALREQNADIRFRTRLQLITTFKMAFGALNAHRLRRRFLVALLTVAGYAAFQAAVHHPLAWW